MYAYVILPMADQTTIWFLLLEEHDNNTICQRKVGDSVLVASYEGFCHRDWLLCGFYNYEKPKGRPKKYSK